MVKLLFDSFSTGRREFEKKEVILEGGKNVFEIIIGIYIKVEEGWWVRIGIGLGLMNKSNRKG